LGFLVVKRRFAERTARALAGALTADLVWRGLVRIELAELRGLRGVADFGFGGGVPADLQGAG
jgi:hypothetical protein